VKPFFYPYIRTQIFAGKSAGKVLSVAEIQNQKWKHTDVGSSFSIATVGFSELQS